MTAVKIIGDVCIVVGALVFATAALGLVRFPDAYTRVSAVGTAGGLGVVLVVTGSLLQQPNAPDAVKVVLIVALQLTTSAVGSMALARSAYLIRTPMLRHYDELGQAGDRQDRADRDGRTGERRDRSDEEPPPP